MPQPLPVSLHGAPFSVQLALRNGVGRSRLRRADLERPFWGIRDWVEAEPSLERPRRETLGSTTLDSPPAGTAPLKPWELERHRALRRATAYGAKLPDDAFFSHVTAAQIRGLPLPVAVRNQSLVDVSVTVRGRRRSGAHVRGHLIASTDVTVQLYEGLPVAAPVDVWCQLGVLLTVDELVIVGDALVRRWEPLATMAELHAAVVRRARRRGVQRLRDALAMVRPRTDSVRETELRLGIVRDGLPEPEVNLAVYDANGTFVGFFDLGYRKYKILIEYDGSQHREDETQYLHDVNRLDAAMAEGWRVVRVNKQHAAERFAISLRRIREALIGRGWRA